LFLNTTRAGSADGSHTGQDSKVFSQYPGPGVVCPGVVCFGVVLGGGVVFGGGVVS